MTDKEELILTSVFGADGFELDSVTLPYIPSDHNDYEHADVTCMVPLSDLLTTEELAKITGLAERSVSQANRRLRKSILPYFSKKNRFRLEMPAEEWALSVWIKLDRQPRSGRFLICARAAVDTVAGVMFVLTETSWCKAEDVENELRFIKKELNAVVSRLYEKIIEKVDIDEYAVSYARTADNLPLAYVYDAVKAFTDYPNSIPEKLNVR